MLIANKRLQCVDHIINRYYETEDLILEWDFERKKKTRDVWVTIVKNMIGPIRQVSAEQTLEQLCIGVKKAEKEGQWLRVEISVLKN